MTPGAGDPRPVHEPARQIPQFDVYAMPDGRWRAVHKTDTALVLEHDDWTELFMVATTVRIRREIQAACDELMERQLRARDEHGRTRLSGPGGGINV